MSLAFFTVSALDLLGTFTSNTTAEQRQDYIDWAYSNQHPQGGFRAFPGTNLGPEFTNAQNAHWDPANLPATYFALSLLLVLGDDLQRVNRKETLKWLILLQRKDGSFGETLVEGKINGGTDSRFGYCATGVRYILRGCTEGTVDGVEDVRVGDFVECIRAAEVCILLYTWWTEGERPACESERYAAEEKRVDRNNTDIRRRHQRRSLPRSPRRLRLLRPRSPLLHVAPEPNQQTHKTAFPIRQHTLNRTHQASTSTPLANVTPNCNYLPRRRSRHVRRRNRHSRNLSRCA